MPGDVTASAPVAAPAIRHHHVHHTLVAVLISFALFTLTRLLLAHFGHRLAHLLVALLKRGDRLLLRLASRLILALVNCVAASRIA